MKTGKMEVSVAAGSKGIQVHNLFPFRLEPECLNGYAIYPGGHLP